eukprot:CAMPEP_0183789586 /NCGR_PEP_ID=MMETSP0803_2-20130417/512_1 /TAXON_ID=195967 /ORGANISM="Crustomastix stigmata, Strain CCMP3273" /LENGTH=653 /DNA_ID=CAMNT_0026033759 /DNA_START=36 /DNA_END=1997 /DNA_ORIENTATION=+
MGNVSGNFKHDPGADGDSGEGDSTIVQFCFVYLITAFILIRREYLKRQGKLEEVQPEQTNVAKLDVKASEAEGGGDAGDAAKTQEEIDDALAQAKWTQPVDTWVLSDANRRMFVKVFSFGLANPDATEGCGKYLWIASGFNYYKLCLIIFVFWVLWIFLLALSLMGTGFKLLGGKDSAKMFDVVDNPISGVMIGVLTTVLVQSSSTSTSIIISLVGADELSVSNAIPMIMGANIGTSVTNTIVAMGHFSNKNDLRRGFSAATVHDLFNLLCVAIFLPLQWATNFLGAMTYEMAKDADACEDEDSSCESQQFLKPYMKPYTSYVASYDKKVAKYIAEGYCDGMCDGVTDLDYDDYMGRITDLVCTTDTDGDVSCKGIDGYKGSWMDDDKLKKKRAPLYLKTDSTGANAEYLLACPEGESAACDAAVSVFGVSGALAADTIYIGCEHFKTGLCDKDLLKGGLMLTDWKLNDEEAGATCTILSILALCCCLFLIVYTLQIVVKGLFARLLKKALALNGYFSIVIGLFITLMVQSSSITTSTLTPLCAVGIISLEEMLPLTLGANIGTTVTGIMAASVVTSNARAAWQVALSHFFFNVFGICIWYPAPLMRNIPLRGARWLGVQTSKYGVWFPLGYTGVVFFVIPAICYGIAVAATS